MFHIRTKSRTRTFQFCLFCTTPIGELLAQNLHISHIFSHDPSRVPFRRGIFSEKCATLRVI